MNGQDSKPTSNGQQKEAKKGEAFEDKIKDNLKNARGAARNEAEDFLNYAKNNKENLITYALLILGLLILLFNSLLGGILIGAVVGYYFSVEITQFLRGMKSFFSGQERLRSLSFLALLFALLVSAPGIFIGGAIAAAVKQQFLS